MKRLLSIIGAISLVGTSTTSLVACNTPQYSEDELKELKEKNKINTANQEIKDNLEWISPQEKPFNKVDNKYYFVIWRGYKNDDWRIIKFKNNTLKFIKIDNFKKYKLWKSSPYRLSSKQTLHVVWNFTEIYWEKDNGTYFKSVYRWNLTTQEPDLILNDDDNIKIKGE